MNAVTWAFMQNPESQHETSTHEAFQIGQIAWLRRYFGLEAMKYS